MDVPKKPPFRPPIPDSKRRRHLVKSYLNDDEMRELNRLSSLEGEGESELVRRALLAMARRGRTG